MRYRSERFSLGASLLPPRVAAARRCEDGGFGTRRVPAAVYGLREASIESIAEMEAGWN